MAVVKADAYGHGAVEVSRVIAANGVDFLGVAFLEEASELQDARIKTPTVILYPETDDRAAEAVTRGFYITISDMKQFAALEALLGPKKTIKYFIKVESGMNRYGMAPDEVRDTISLKDSRPESAIMGITTNLADPVGRDSARAQKQIEKFMGIMNSIKNLSNNGLHYSLESSGALWANKKAEGTLVRVGHLLYGLVPGEQSSSELLPVMSVKSYLAEIHDLKPGDGVGYGFTYIAEKNSRIATIPLGYADGYPWSLSNKGSVLVRGKRAPIVGRICMDAFMIDVTDIAGAQAGDETVILGTMNSEKIDAHDLGRWAGSFSYEILSRWNKRLPRIYL
jgi:alanine racemase